MREWEMYRGYALLTDPETGRTDIRTADGWLSEAENFPSAQRIVDEWLNAR